MNSVAQLQESRGDVGRRRAELAYAIIGGLEAEYGYAPWDEVVDEMMKRHGATKEEAEEAANHIIDTGRVYEPYLGRLKVEPGLEHLAPAI